MSHLSRSVTTALALLLGLGCALPAAAQWKWRDANGRMIYSDRPPPASVPQSAILERPPGMTPRAVPPSPATPSLVPGTPAVVSQPSANAASAPPRSDPELEARRKKEADAEAARQKADEAKLAAAKAENCSRARGQLKILDDGVRIARTNEKGEREILDDKGRAAEQARLRQTIANDCR